MPLPELHDAADAAAQTRGEIVVDGIGVSPGVAVGPVYLYAGGAYQADPQELGEDEIEAEAERFERAIARSERELGKIRLIARQKLGDGSAGIFDAQALILRDSQFYDRVHDFIRKRRMGAGWATQEVLDEHRQRLLASDSPLLRDRAGDFFDVQNRVLRNLQHGRAVSRIDKNRIVIAKNLTAADVLLFSRHGVLGVVLDHGGPTSHVSIMARALGVPTSVSLHGLAAQVNPGDEVIVDGFSGRVIVNPTDETREAYTEKQARFANLEATRDEVVAEPSETADGHHVSLQANVEFPQEFPLLHTFGAEGVGLFRTEMLFLTQGRALDEEQQFEVYRDAVAAAAPHAVTFRLLDLGGDKVLPMARREANPFLGWRGLRILLDKPEILRPQIRAILRAAAASGETDAPARLLLPMVSSLDEVRLTRAAIREVIAELEEAGVEHRSDIQVGIMVEVPAVALMADRFARVSDFFSIGTNDLTQFTLAVDRGNDLVAGRYRELHPAVLGLIAQTVEAAHARGIPVSVCGEMAADPRITPLLVGLGVDSLSASPAYLSLVKRVLRALTMDEARDLATRALRQPDADAVGRLLDYWLVCHNRDLAALLGADDAVRR
ncbi:phosphoenolpyruvate--protein phosphotransferase [Rubricoccus marinus]|uniref:Phosphoenolpyruvate-protein phosphotransferase n=1 Tax=Rubricoccus marinus TaxID=716817 RepID=A0A259U064_9BACT|nr:phosphoenolpyruvate--protein phosphotransferase [Rubricoccus marinus]OZC03214.1 phosphoenolpyruvate--protein phosphotransferase [Rubricoccus marinus]